MKKTQKLLCFLILIGFQCFAQNSFSVENQKLTIASIGSTNYEIKSKGELLVRSSISNISGKVNFTSDSAWLILDGVLPSAAIASHLSYISVNGQPAINNVNISVTNYLQGCLIIPHSPTYNALSLFKEERFVGEEMKCYSYKYYKIADLGTFDNSISSFKLKKGYMATFAQNENGGGFSKVYIADNDDVEISILPVGLNNLVSFVRVFPWRYTTKKGFGAGLGDFNRSIKAVQLTKSSWFYNWGVPSFEDLTDYEFVPMLSYANSLTSPKWQEINNINYASHVLGYNEPDTPGILNMPLDKMLLFWPKYLESGMRLGSPAVAASLPLLYNFIDKCDELNYRVDFVCVHDYGEGTALSFFNKCKAIHDRTGRPIWITEFNWGGSWTSIKKPDYAFISKRINEIIEKYDTEGIIERYAIFNFDEDINRSVFYTPVIPDYLFTPIGNIYRDNVSPMAFNAAEQIDISLKLVAPQNVTVANFNAATNILKWDKSSFEFGTIFIERSFGSSGYSTIAEIKSTNSTYTDDVSVFGFGKYNYRLSTKQAGFANSKSVVVSLDVNPNTIFNVALNKPATASSTLSSLYPASFAVDGNNTADASRWVNERGVVPAILEIDLQGNFLISQIKIFTGFAGYNNPLTNFTFEYWDEDTQSWKAVITETSNSVSDYSKIFAEVKTNKVRLYINAVSTDNTVRLYEIEVYGRIATLGINDVLISKFNIYPNPTSDILKISGDGTVSSLQIFDVQGKSLISQRNSSSVDVSLLAKGTYFMKVNNNESIKFIKN